MEGMVFKFSDFLDRKDPVDRQILRLAKKGVLDVGLVFLDDKK